MKTDFLTLRIDPDLAQALARHKDETGCPTGEFVRRILRKEMAGGPRVETRNVPVLLATRREGTNDADAS